MSMQRTFGIILLLGGIALVLVGVNASHSMADQLSNTFLGRFTHSTVMYTVGGGAAALFGLLIVLGDVRSGKP